MGAEVAIGVHAESAWRVGRHADDRGLAGGREGAGVMVGRMFLVGFALGLIFGAVLTLMGVVP